MRDPRVMIEELSDGRFQVITPAECPAGHPYPFALRIKKRYREFDIWCSWCKEAKRQADPVTKSRREQKRKQVRKLHEIGLETMRKRNGLG